MRRSPRRGCTPPPRTSSWWPQDRSAARSPPGCRGPVDLLEEADQGSVVVLILPGPLHPFAAVAAGIVRALVAPVRVTVGPGPVILEPPFIVDPVQFTLAAVLVDPVEQIVPDRLHLLAHGVACRC